MLSNEEKRKLDKINMVLNNLEQKLNYDMELCKEMANVIDVIVENNALEERLNKVDTHIPVLVQKIKSLIKGCNYSCNEAREKVLVSIQKILLDNKDEEKVKRYIDKIQKTIDCCVEEYEMYIRSTYYSKYHNGNDKNDVLGMNISDLIVL